MHRPRNTKLEGEPSPGTHRRRKPKTLSPQERRNIFAHMVRMELHQGKISHWSRQRLIGFASDIGIAETEAASTISETQQNFGTRTAPGVDSDARRCQEWPAWRSCALIGGACWVAYVILSYYFSV